MISYGFMTFTLSAMLGISFPHQAHPQNGMGGTISKTSHSRRQHEIMGTL